MLEGHKYMSLSLPENLKDKASEFPESSYGANRVTLILPGGRKIQNVVLAWGGEIVKIGNNQIASEDDLNFKVAEVEDIVSEI
jgi:hypothetical protein